MTESQAIEILDRIQGAINKLYDENAKLRDALRFIANHTAEPDTPLATVVNFARLTLEEAHP